MHRDCAIRLGILNGFLLYFFQKKMIGGNWFPRGLLASLRSRAQDKIEPWASHFFLSIQFERQLKSPESSYSATFMVSLHLEDVKNHCYIHNFNAFRSFRHSSSWILVKKWIAHGSIVLALGPARMPGGSEKTNFRWSIFSEIFYI